MIKCNCPTTEGDTTQAREAARWIDWHIGACHHLDDGALYATLTAVMMRLTLLAPNGHGEQPRSVQRRIAAQNGLPAPDFSAPAADGREKLCECGHAKMPHMARCLNCCELAPAPACSAGA